MSSIKEHSVVEKPLNPISGFIALGVVAALFILMIPLFLLAISGEGITFLLIIVYVYWGIIFPISIFGFRIIKPNESAVYTLFGKYYGTLAKEGFYFINPFCAVVNSKISRRTNVFSNLVKNARDSKGNLIEVNTEIIWRVENATKAVFSVDNYKDFVEAQCEFSVRTSVKKFPYYPGKGKDSKALSVDFDDVAAKIKSNLQSRVSEAGAEILELRILTVDKVYKPKKLPKKEPGNV